MEFSALVESAKAIQSAYRDHNEQCCRGQWTATEYMQGFVGDVGDLAKLIMAKDGFRTIDDVDAKIGHELSDCLWSLIIIAEELNIDLEAAFLDTMETLSVTLGAPRP